MNRLPVPYVMSTVQKLREYIGAHRDDGYHISLVPTMGALHAGHAKLIEACRDDHPESNFVVVSIFVNPTQFGPGEDLDRYPRALEADRQLCHEAGADLIFAPTPSEMYPAGFCTYVEPTGIQDRLCGQSRPGHFRGVCTVVLKLFNIVQPDAAYFGQKDAQQVTILERMVSDLNVNVRIVRVPTVRESDGLAMSSRNIYLDAQQRRHAVVLSQALQRIEQMVRKGERRVDVLENVMREMVTATPGARLDYARIVDAKTLDDLVAIDGPALAALAVFFGSTRLIDNTILRGAV